MKSASKGRKKIYYFLKRERLNNLINILLFFFCLICLTILVSFYVLYIYPTNIKLPSNQDFENKTSSLIQVKADVKSCDLYKGQWVPDTKGSLYTNFSCSAIPFQRNCFLNGRKDTDFLHWRWKPDECDLPRFDPKTFLNIFHGKTMAFIGDSLARNQMESLLCLLSLEETPIQIYKDADKKFTTWEFPQHNFTLMVFWSQFLVTATDRLINGTASGGFDLQLDKVNGNWSEKLPLIDYAVFSDAHWFFRQNYLYENENLIGCVYCQQPNVTDLGPSFAIRRAFQTAFKYINECDNCKRIFTFLRTYSPSHFENAAWNEGGRCNRTKLVAREKINRDGWEYREIQKEEFENARKEGEKRGNRFEILDVTEIMQMRVDGHPGEYWGNKWMKGYHDCIHWCLPGPIDVWNELLLEVIRRQNPVSHN